MHKSSKRAQIKGFVTNCNSAGAASASSTVFVSPRLEGQTQEGIRPHVSYEFSLKDHYRWLLETWSFGHVLTLGSPPAVLSFGATAAAMPSCPEDEHQFINGSRRNLMVVEEASCWALPRKESLHGSHMWTQHGPQAAPRRLDPSPQLWSCGCWTFLLTAGGCGGAGRGQAWERSPSGGHPGSKTDVFQPSNQTHDTFLPKPRSTCVFEWHGERHGGLPPKKGEPLKQQVEMPLQTGGKPSKKQ